MKISVIILIPLILYFSFLSIIILISSLPTQGQN